MLNKIDHFAVGAKNIAQGMDFVLKTLGITMSPGGKHDLMSTHNCVMQSGNESFFELIAIDPEAPTPGRTRWFTLDDMVTQRKLSVRPHALCWVVNTDELDAVVAASPVDLGEIVHFQRGDRSWRLTVPIDGHLPGNGLLPAFIEWSPGPHPSSAQQDLGATLTSIQISHPEPTELQATLETLQVAHLVTVIQGTAGLSFKLDSPNGTVILD
jgi:hypothetical protein